MAEVKRPISVAAMALDPLVRVYVKPDADVYIDALERRLRELEIRIRDVTFEYKVPDRYRRVRTAYSSGYESGWRGKPLDNPYSSMHHQDAYATGWRTANLAVLLEIDSELTKRGQ